jgi:hypothetical protein
MTKIASSINYCTRENQINKIIKDQKFRKRREYFLFISLWDDVCCALVKELEENPPPFTVNVINSFDTPHSFVIWGVTKSPALVIAEPHGKKVSVTDFVSDIYKKLRLEK